MNDIRDGNSWFSREYPRFLLFQCLPGELRLLLDGYLVFGYKYREDGNPFSFKEPKSIVSATM